MQPWSRQGWVFRGWGFRADAALRELPHSPPAGWLKNAEGGRGGRGGAEVRQGSAKPQHQTPNPSTLTAPTTHTWERVSLEDKCEHGFVRMGLPLRRLSDW